MTTIAALLFSAALIAVVLWDAFETILLPRTVTHRFRLTRFFVRGAWVPWRWIADWFVARRRDRFLAVFGPLALLALLVLWAAGLVFGFAGLQWAAGSHLRPIRADARFLDDLYMSGTTFTTLGIGDLQPIGTVARILTITEAGTGFAFFAIVIAYLPVLYQSFSRREARLTLMDAWAGSPPAAGEVLRRLASRSEMAMLVPFLKEWEYWCADILESHISYPLVAFFRSQHQQQSWVSALSCVLDLSALVEVGIESVPTWQAYLTFAIARHTAVDLAQVFRASVVAAGDRLPDRDLERMRDELEAAGLKLTRSAAADERLRELRRSYEPYLLGLSRTLMMPTPPWWHANPANDNWQTSPRRLEQAHF